MAKDKTRISLDVNDITLQKLGDVQRIAEQYHGYAVSVIELFRKSLSLMSLVYEQLAKGGKVIIEEKDGTKTVLKII